MGTNSWYRGSIFGGGGVVEFFYNPLEVKITKQTKWNHLAAAGREQPILQYGCGEARHFDIELTLARSAGDTYAKNTVEKLIDMCRPKSQGAGVDSPYKVRLMLGDALKVDCIIDSVDAVYGPMFDPNSLNPYTGKVSVKLTEIME